MSFDQKERSNYQGKPITLYEFRIDNLHWRYNSSQNTVTVAGVVYESIPITHDSFSMSGNPSTDDITIRLSGYAEVTELFKGTPPSNPLALSIRTLHHGDSDAPVVWSGFVKAARRISAVEVQLSANSLLASLNRAGLRLGWQRTCPHALYDRMCKVNPANYATRVKITAISGDRITAAGLGSLQNGYLAGGFLSFTSETGQTERRAIESSSGGGLTLMGNSDGLRVGQDILVYPGCDRTTSMCQTRFRNIGNYGGFPYLPTKSPFDGDPVF